MKTDRARRLSWGSWTFIVLMLALMLLCVWLGVWQVQRLAEKEALVAAVETGLSQPPIDLAAATAGRAPDDYVDPATGEVLPFGIAYRAVNATGHYIAADSVLVFTSLADPNGQFSGPGYWVMTPLALDAGGMVFVNRGFVPQPEASRFVEGSDLVGGTVTVTGIARASEAVGSFTPAPDTEGRIDWVRNTERLAAFSTGLPQPVLPIFIDLPSAGPGLLPQGGETVVEFPNNHLGYAITWFGFALLVPFLLGFWVRRQLRPSSAA